MAPNFELVVIVQLFSVNLVAYKWFKVQRHLPSCGINVTFEYWMSNPTNTTLHIRKTSLGKFIHFAVLLFGIFFIIGISVGTGNLVKWREREVLMKTLGGLSIVLRSKRCLPKGNCSSTFHSNQHHQGCWWFLCWEEKNDLARKLRARLL